MTEQPPVPDPEQPATPAPHQPGLPLPEQSNVPYPQQPGAYAPQPGAYPQQPGAYAPQPGANPQQAAPPTPEQRRRNLAQAVQVEVAGGWRVESQTDESAILVKGGQTNHTLHLILTILTCSAWGIVWLIMFLVNQRKVTTLRVDEFGNVLRSQM